MELFHLLAYSELLNTPRLTSLYSSFSSHQCRRMTRRRVGTQKDEKVWEATHGGAIIGLRTIVAVPVVLNLAIESVDRHIRNETIGFEASSQYNHVSGDDSLWGSHTIGYNFGNSGFLQLKILAVQRFKVAGIVYAALKE